jgi:hypothetical protein
MLGFLLHSFAQKHGPSARTPRLRPPRPLPEG